MSTESHNRYLLDLLAREGPLSRRQLDQRTTLLGPELEARMEEALQRLLRTGDILKGEGRVVYYVAPARLIPVGSEHPSLYWLVGHPAAEAVLAALGKVAGPDERGRRLFRSGRPRAELRPRLQRCAIALEVTGP